MANKTSQEETAVKEVTASKDDTEKESKAADGEQSPSGNKPLAAKSGYYYAHNQVPFTSIFMLAVDRGIFT